MEKNLWSAIALKDFMNNKVYGTAHLFVCVDDVYPRRQFFSKFCFDSLRPSQKDFNHVGTFPG